MNNNGRNEGEMTGGRTEETKHEDDVRKGGKQDR